MPTGPSIEAPVVLLKTWNPSLTIWTYCVAPTSPFVSGGAQLQATPGNGIPLKFRPGAGMFGRDGCDWTTVSRTSLCSETARGFGLASISRPGSTRERPAHLDADPAAGRAREHHSGSHGQRGNGKHADHDKGAPCPCRAAPLLSQLHPPIPSLSDGS